MQYGDGGSRRCGLGSWSRECYFAMARLTLGASASRHSPLGPSLSVQHEWSVALRSSEKTRRSFVEYRQLDGYRGNQSSSSDPDQRIVLRRWIIARES